LYDKGQLINPYGVPLINTFVLLTSACFITMSHKSIKLNNFFIGKFFLFITIFLGVIFMAIQLNEYENAMVSSNDGIYGSAFFALTGLHGFHVFIGILFLFYCFINIFLGRYSRKSHISFEFAI
jgi:heme/copper-type cytochrome/quinol oxidase subunit 3